VALKDLAADLENFKYGISSPDRIDGQIESGVDFFDNETGGADGFTPKTNLESLYHKVQNATFGPVGGGADTYANLNPITPFRSIFELGQDGFPVQPGEDDPLITLNIDNNILNTVPQLPNAFGSNFMTTPLEGYISRLPNDVFNDTPNTSLYSQTFTIDTDTNLFSQQNNFLSPNVANAFGSDFMTTPIGGAFSRIDDRNTLTSRVGDEIFDDTHRIPNAAGSDFMTTPILNRLTAFSDPSDSLTLSVGDVDFNNDPRIPNARRIGNTISPLADIVGINTGISSFPASNPDISSPDITFDGIAPTFDPNEQRLKQRGYFDTYVNTEFNNKLLENRYFTELGTSIHISPFEQINAGLRYGAMVGQTFETFDAGTRLIDVVRQTVPQAVNIFPVPQFEENRTYGQYFRPGIASGIQVFTVTDTGQPSITWTLNRDGVAGDRDGRRGDGQVYIDASTSPFTSLTSPLNTPTSNRNSPNLYGFDRARYDGIRNDGENVLDDLKDIVIGYKDNIDDLYKFANGQFSKVPAGLSTENLFSKDNYRTVANKGPFTGKDNHPLILREIGNNWGINPPEEPGPIGSFFSALGSSIFRGAPGLTGLIDRNLTDKKRLFKYMALTPEGLAFTTKQFALQLLNPDKGTIIYNPASTLGIAGANNILEGDVSGLIQAAVSAALPISHVERHLGGYRYEEAVNSKGQVDNVGSNSAFSETGVSRLAFQAVALEEPINVGAAVDPDGAFARFLPGLAGLVTNVSDAITSTTNKGVNNFIRSNPNRYSVFNLLSTAPQSIGKDGSISFSGGPQLATQDLRKVATTVGSTFDDDSPSNKKDKDNNSGILQKFSTLSYTQLGRNDAKYTTAFGTSGKDEIATPKEINDFIDGTGNEDNYKVKIDARVKGSKIVKHIGEVISPRLENIRTTPNMERLGVIKGTTNSNNVDRINILPVIDGDSFAGVDGGDLPEVITNNPDFIKFMFKDVVNNKYLVFRAILDGISDTITPEFNEEKYIGRPDKLYTYSGTERNIQFNFKIYPKTKQELPVLIEKLNYLVGMCYPSYTQSERMITPFIELTLGDMFNKAPGLLGGLTVTVEDETTWEIDEGLQYPHFISCACEFKYIGGKQNIPVALGKHYDIPWLKGDNRIGDTGAPIGTFENAENNANRKKQPSRSDEYDYISAIAGT